MAGAMTQSLNFKNLLPSFVHQLSNLMQVVLVDVSSALIAHAFFRKFEPEDIRTGLTRFAFFTIAPIATAVINHPSQNPWVDALLHCGLFTCVLLCSILLYRISPFHPMAKYPGPFICKISKFWMAWLFHKGKVYLYLKELHEQYGSVVRIGPNELSVVNADLLPQILGNQGMPKGPMWEGRQPTYIKNRKTGGSIVTIRDADLHAKYRKTWTRAFGPEPLRDYEESLVTHANEMIWYLQENCRKSPNGIARANMTRWMSYLSFDMMGETAFGEGFQLMREGDKNGYFADMRKAIMEKAITMTIPWALGFARAFHMISGKSNNGKYSSFTLQLAQKRIRQVVTNKRDLFYHLSANMDIPDEKLVISNASLAVLAGSDTTSATLTGMLYYLLLYPEYFTRLQNEIDEAFPPSDSAEIQIDKLANLEFLNAVINETMRLEPAIFSYLQRAPAEGSGGRRLGDMFIPERTAIVVPPYVLHRSPQYFYPNPDKFWPERWLINPDTENPNEHEKIIHNRSAFIPFGMGPASCAGKPLALSQLRYIAALLVYNFDFLFDAEYQPWQWEKDLVDKLVIMKGPLPVQMRIRSRR